MGDGHHVSTTATAMAASTGARPSMFPGAGGPSSSQATKQRQVAHLAGRLAELTKRMEALGKQVESAQTSAQAINQLGASHAAFFMASARILTPVNAPDQDQETSEHPSTTHR